jgi:hypothetical protein
MLITKKTNVATKLMKIVLYSIKFELNEARGNTKAKVNTKQTELVLKCAKSKLNLAIANAKIKLDAKLH